MHDDHRYRHPHTAPVHRRKHTPTQSEKQNENDVCTPHIKFTSSSHHSDVMHTRPQAQAHEFEQLMHLLSA